MRRRHEISDHDWDRIKKALPGRAGQHGGIAVDNRLFINAVLWIVRAGSPWADLPERFGKSNTVWRRFDRWVKSGVWASLMEALRDTDIEWLMVDSTVIRAHPCAAGAKKKPMVAAARMSNVWAEVEADSPQKSMSA